MAHDIAPVHPGEILMEEFLRPLGLSQYRLAVETHVPPRRINEIVKGQRSITADTAMRLARFFATSEMFWLNLQAQYDLDVEKERSPETYGAIRPVADTIREASPARSRAHHGRRKVK